jgi:acyl-CoA synthetase (NDP forming)
VVEPKGLETIFDPQSVAIVGASKNPAKLGYHVMKSLTEGGFRGDIFPINPGVTELLGFKAYSSLLQVAQPIDLSIIVLPAQVVPRIFRECAEKSVKGIVLISAGFKEIEDEYGSQLEDEIAKLANEAGISVIGPNTFGAINLPARLNASFTPEFSRLEKGKISLVSQSGGMAHLIGFMALDGHVGLNKIVGVGNRCNVDFADLLQYLAEDQSTGVIAMYLEGTDNPRRLIKVARGTRGEKPIVVYKVGRSRISDKASRFHTGSLAGQYEIYRRAFKQAGILAVNSSEELLDTAKALAACPQPGGGGIAVLSGQAGLGMAACDICEENGSALAAFSAETQMRIEEALPPLAIRTNPIDMGPAWHNLESTREVVNSVLADENVCAMILCIAYASANRDVVESLADLLKNWGRKKPIVCCLSSPGEIWNRDIRSLEEVGVPNYPTPERAARALGNILRYEKLATRGTDDE